jgi:uncharacterized phage protein (TIGR02216 family)
MHLTLGVLRVPARDFWRLSLPELDAILSGALGLDMRGGLPSRTDLDALMRRFPD